MLSIQMGRVIRQSVIMLRGVMLNVILWWAKCECYEILRLMLHIIILNIVMLSVVMLSITMLRIVMIIFIMLFVIPSLFMLGNIMIKCSYAEYHYSNCHYAECLYAEYQTKWPCGTIKYKKKFKTKPIFLEKKRGKVKVNFHFQSVAFFFEKIRFSIFFENLFWKDFLSSSPSNNLSSFQKRTLFKISDHLLHIFFAAKSFCQLDTLSTCHFVNFQIIMLFIL